MQFLIAVSIGLAAFLLTMLVTKKQRLFADRYLIIYLAFFIVNESYFYIEWSGLLEESTGMILGKGLYLLSAPLFFHYVHALTKGRQLPVRIYLLTFAPFAAYVITFFYYQVRIFPFHALSTKLNVLSIDGQVSQVWLFFILLFLITEPFYLGWFFKLFTDYRKRLNNAVSTVDKINLGWLSMLLYIWLILVILLVPTSVLTVGNDLVSDSVLFGLVQVANMIFIFIAGYYGFKQTNIFTDPTVVQPKNTAHSKSSYEKSGLTNNQALEYHKQLLQIMDTEKLYLDGELNASHLATRLNISVNHLSQVLNQYQLQNFFDFVNGYRVEEVKRRMKDPANNHLTLLAIALDSGFSSKTSFNTVFKKITGSTPSQFLKIDMKSRGTQSFTKT